MSRQLTPAQQQAWADALARLAVYVEAHGDARVPARYADADGFRLGSWVSVQRQRADLGRMPDDRRAALDALGFVWAPRHDTLDATLADVHRLRRGAQWPANVPFEIVLTLRGFRKRGTLPAGVRAELEAIGFPWRKGDIAFARGLVALRAWLRANPSARPSRSVRVGDFPLGVWLHNVTVLDRAGHLPARRTEALNAAWGTKQ